MEDSKDESTIKKEIEKDEGINPKNLIDTFPATRKQIFEKIEKKKILDSYDLDEFDEDYKKIFSKNNDKLFSDYHKDNESEKQIKIIKKKEIKKEKEFKEDFEDKKEENKEIMKNKKEEGMIKLNEDHDENIYPEIPKFDKIKGIKFIDYLNINENIYTTWENKNSLENKKSGINKNNYFQNYILKDQSIINIIPKEKLIQYFEEISNNYIQNISIFQNIFSYIDSSQKNQIFNNLKRNYNKFNDYIINPSIFSKEDFEKIYHIKTDLFNSFRYIYPENGDSFYRAFIFLLFENYIINQSLDEFCILIYDIYRFYEITKDIYNNLNIEKSLVIFSIIYDLMKTSQWNDAYETFLYCFLDKNDDSFDQILIRYVRYCVFAYLLNLEFQNNSNQEVKNTKNLYNYKLGIMYYNEPTRYVIDALPNIFGVNLNIFYIEGDMKKIKKKDFTKNKGSNITINIGYFYTNYHIIYQNSEKIQQLYSKNNPNLNTIISGEKTSKKQLCSKCKSNLLYVNFPQAKKSTCINCLENKILEVLNERIQLCFQENYINYCFYMRPIKISKDIIISDADYINLFNKSFTECCSQTLISLCYKCNKTSSDLIQLNCGCHYCKNCLMDLINLSTNSNIILNIYEKKKTKKIRCHCENDFNYEEAIENLIDENKYNEKKKEAEERLITYCEEKCLNCLKKFERNMNVRSNHKKPSYYEMDIKINKLEINERLIEGIDYCEERHILCPECFEKLSENKDKNNFVFEGREYKIIKCHICNINHLVDKLKWKKLFPKPVCSKGCFIF